MYFKIVSSRSLIVQYETKPYVFALHNISVLIFTRLVLGPALTEVGDATAV